MDTNTLIKKAKEKYGDKYDLSETVYANMDTKIKVICPKHGVFYKNYYKFICGYGCSECIKEERRIKNSLTTQEFIEKAKQVHGDKYDYSKVNYINNSTKVCIICPTHGEFWQTPNSHLQNVGCSKCGTKKAHEKLKNKQDAFIEKCKVKHNGEYNYDKTVYVNNRTKIIVMCPKHGDFSVNPYKHLYRGDGCPKCRYIKTSKSNSLTTQEFIEKAKQVHGDKYDYSKTIYEGYDKPLTIICKKHGEFLQTPDSHLQGSGCQRCSHATSKQEDEIFNFIASEIGIENIIRKDRQTIKPKEIDILIPTLGVGFEFGGLRWHTEEFGKDKNYHLNKLNESLNHGIKLYQIFGDEYYYHKEIVLNKIKHILHTNNGTKICGRKCKIREINFSDSKTFLNKYHIQGFHRSSLHLGAFYGEDLIGVMSFTKENKNSLKWELSRFATNYNFICQGIGGKLFKYFTKNYDFSEIKSFADRRWTLDLNLNLYTKLGFTLDKIIPPDYRYYSDKNPYQRIHKFNFRKTILEKKYDLDFEKTENEMAKQIGYSKIYDCGLLKYVYIKKI